MAIQSNTIATALDAVEAVFSGGTLQSELDLFNAQMSPVWTLVAPREYLRGAVANVTQSLTPAMLLNSQADAPIPHSATERGYHVFKIAMVLRIGLDDVRAGATQVDLYDAVVTYSDACRRALVGDVSTADPGSLLRAAGVLKVNAFSTYYQPLESGATSSAPFIHATMTAILTQLRPQRTV